MRRLWIKVRWLGAFLMMGSGWMGSGCWTTEPSLKPPPHAEEYQVPPEDDARFSQPVQYPKETLNQDTILKKRAAAQQPGPGAGAGPRLGGGGSPGGY